MNYEETLMALQAKMQVVTEQNITKIIKPIDGENFSGSYSPFLLPSLQGLVEPSDLVDDLDELRSGNDIVGTKDLAGDDVITVRKVISFMNRNVQVEELTPIKTDLDRILIYFHGGAFYGGRIEDLHHFLKLVALKSGIKVINVDYHLAPEMPYPASILDGLAVSLYYRLHENFDRMLVGGDSAGVNLAIGVKTLLQHLGYPTFGQQILLYPVLTLADDENTKLWDLSAYPISKNQEIIRDHYRELFMSLNKLMRKYYLRHQENLMSPFISPLYSDCNNEPETLILVGEYDFYRLQNEAFTRKVMASGGKTHFVQYNGMAHAFAPLVGLFPQAEDAATEVSRFIKNEEGTMYA